ncbi:hypothetical protein [Massilia varians]|uniref:hypothetical protein n=1 Tax=Massilia varians TaxID=457921 RepID=UPI0025537F48|nr:hypothetical protein [Massilia varians]MDK6079498.1 hypothetical protein [Massilia varians]
MNARYIDAERKLAVALNWTDTAYNGPTGDAHWPAVGIAPGQSARGSIPAWTRSNDECVNLMLEHSCFVAKEVSDSGTVVMVARWAGVQGLPESLSVPVAQHDSDAAAFRYAVVLGVTAKVEAEAFARELDTLVAA